MRVALGGVRDEAEIRGHRRTYVGAQPGRIVKAITEAGTMNPVVLLDEVDKLGAGAWSGDPTAALLEVLDPAQNHTFRDHYLELDLDLSEVVFIATANVLDTVPAPLLDRMDVVRLDGYTDEEKVFIARRYLLPRQAAAGRARRRRADRRRRHDPRRRPRLHPRGRRALARARARPADPQGRGHASPPASELPALDADHLADWLGRAEGRRRRARAHRAARRGHRPGRHRPRRRRAVHRDDGVPARRPRREPALTLTGQLGDVMKESAQIALNYVRSHAAELGIDPEAVRRRFHVHVPAGAVPKDGPSAGITMTTALVSLLRDQPVKETVGMTGEITLQGAVLPDRRRQAEGAGRPPRRADRGRAAQAQRADLEDVPEEVRAEMTFHLADHVRATCSRPPSPEPSRRLPAACRRPTADCTSVLRPASRAESETNRGRRRWRDSMRRGWRRGASCSRSRPQLERRIDEELTAEWDVPLGWFDVLAALQRLGGRARPSELADELRLVRSSLSRRLDRLEEEGWVAPTRPTSRDDHRAVVVELTRRGPGAVAGDERHLPPRRAAHVSRCSATATSAISAILGNLAVASRAVDGLTPSGLGPPRFRQQTDLVRPAPDRRRTRTQEPTHDHRRHRRRHPHPARQAQRQAQGLAPGRPRRRDAEGARRPHRHRPGLVDDVVMGCVMQVGEQGVNIARNAVLAAGWPETVPGTTIDRQCGSSQQAAHFAAQGVIAGAYDVVVAAGVEVMTRVPMGASMADGKFGYPFGPKVGARYADQGGLVPQGISAELIADKWDITREDLDALRRPQPAARRAGHRRGPLRARDPAGARRRRRDGHRRRGAARDDDRVARAS